jgi:hypothetical protein
MRKAPADHAAAHKDRVMKGVDGMYISAPDKNGVYKWVKVHTYDIHDNGGRPYVVYTAGKRVMVYSKHYDAQTDSEIIKGKIMDITCAKIFIGDDKPKSKWNPTAKNWGLGNSVLLQRPSGTYVYIGDGIKEFAARPDDTIVDYLSPVGNNDVPYPYAIGKKFMYHMLEGKYIPIDNTAYISKTKDWNEEVYGRTMSPEEHKEWSKRFKKLPTKVLFKRGALYG